MLSWSRIHRKKVFFLLTSNTAHFFSRFSIFDCNSAFFFFNSLSLSFFTRGCKYKLKQIHFSNSKICACMFTTYIFTQNNYLLTKQWNISTYVFKAESKLHLTYLYREGDKILKISVLQIDVNCPLQDDEPDQKIPPVLPSQQVVTDCVGT